MTTETELKNRKFRVEGERVVRFMEAMRPLLENLSRPNLLPAIAQNIDAKQTQDDWLFVMMALRRRFELEQVEYDRRKHLDEVRRKGCPYSAAEYDAAVEAVGTKQEVLASKLSVDRKTLRKYGRPST